MRVTVKCPFNDIVEGAYRELGETFECTDERAEKLVSYGLVDAVEEKQPAKPAPKKRAPRKKA